LPPLQFGKKTERRHAGARVARVDLPIQLPVGLRLHVWPAQIRSLRRASALFAVARRAPLLKQLRAAGRGVRPIQQRVHLRGGLWRRRPRCIALARLRQQDRH
jgi:hypothetical protein